MSPKLHDVLKKYLNQRTDEYTPEDFLFPTENKTQMQVNHLGESIRRYSRRRGIAKTSLHLYRHTYAKCFIQNGGDIFSLQKLLDHKSLDVVREYVNMFSDDLQKDYDKLCPLDTLIHEQGEYIRLRGKKK
jgi:integrase/recombinase XerD